MPLVRKKAGLIRLDAAPTLEVPDASTPDEAPLSDAPRAPTEALAGADNYSSMYNQASDIAGLTSFEELSKALKKTSHDLRGTPEGQAALGAGSGLLKKAVVSKAFPAHPNQQSGLQRIIQEQAKSAGTSVTDKESSPSTPLWSHIASAFDWPARQFRAATNPEIPYDPSNHLNDPETWNQLQRINTQKVEAGTRPAGPMAGATKLTEHLGAPLDYLGGAVGAGLGALDSAYKETPGEQPGKPPNLQAAWDAIKNPVRGQGQNLMMGLAFDPLSYVGLGTAGEGPTAAKQAMRGLRASGQTTEEASKTAQAIQKLVETSPTLEKGKAALEAFKAGGGSDLEALKRFGQNAEKLGKPGLKVGSFLGSGGMELSDLFPSLSERPLLSAMERGREGAAKLTGKTYLDPLKRQALKQQLAQEFHGSLQRTHEGLSDYGNNVATKLPADKTEREAFAQNVLDPQQVTQELAPEEAMRKAAHDSFYAKHSKDLEAAGLPGLPTNNASGSPIPRQVSKYPLGSLATDEAKNIRYDPHEIVTHWLPQKEKAVAESNIQHYLADHFSQFSSANAPAAIEANGSHIPLQNSKGETVYVPKDVAEKVDAAFQRSGARGALDRIMNPVMQHFKEMNLFPAPRYHINNMLGDSVLMAAGGLREPHIAEVKQLFNEKVPGETTLFKSPTGEVWTKDRLLGEMKLHGAYDAQGGGRFDIGPYQSKRQILRGFQEASEEGQGQKAGAVTRGLRRLPESAKDILSGGVPGASPLRAGKAIAGAWENQSNAMFVIDRLKKGDSIAGAIQHLREVKPDYAMKGPLAQTLKRAFPFATWQIETGKNLPQNMMRAPWLVNAPTHIAQSLVGADDSELQNQGTPNFQARGPNIPLNTGARGLVRRGMEKLGGDKIAPGLGINALVRNPVFEGLAPWQGLAEGSPDAAIGLSGPFLQGATNVVAQKNLFTGRDQDRITPKAIFNQGHGPASLQARPGQLSASELLAPLATSPLTVAYLNRLFHKPLTSPAVGPNYGPSEFSNMQEAKSFLQLLSGVPIEPNTPMSQFQGLSDELEKAGKVLGAVKSLPRKRRNLPKKADE